MYVPRKCPFLAFFISVQRKKLNFLCAPIKPDNSLSSRRKFPNENVPPGAGLTLHLQILDKLFVGCGW